MKILSDLPHRRSPFLMSNEVGRLRFPVSGITHIVEFVCKGLTNHQFGDTSFIEVGFLGIDTHEIDPQTQDYDTPAYETFVPLYDGSGNPMVIRRNCGIAIPSPRTGVIILRASNMPKCFISVHPSQELISPSSGLRLPSLQ